MLRSGARGGRGPNDKQPKPDHEEHIRIGRIGPFARWGAELAEHYVLGVLFTRYQLS